jgi:hypothetical protein
MAIADPLTELGDMSAEELRRAWQRLTGEPPPRVSPSILRHALAWELQARAQGGLPRGLQQRLAQMEARKTRTSAAGPGTRLVREWQGTVHVVTVGEDKVVRWNGAGYRSLSEVARAITGTRWSGPAFFGLRKKLAA